MPDAILSYGGQRGAVVECDPAVLRVNPQLPPKIAQIRIVAAPGPAPIPLGDRMGPGRRIADAGEVVDASLVRRVSCGRVESAHRVVERPPPFRGLPDGDVGHEGEERS